MAQRRCLMILSVLSGEKTVEEATAEAEIQPALYYHDEKKALTAMLAALVPGATKDGSPAPVLAQMEKRIQELEATKRRLERLLFLTRMTVSGPLTTGKRGRPRTKPTEESGPTKTASRGRRPRTRTRSAKTSETSTPTPAGAGGS